MNLAAELLAITQSLRAHLEWQAECGTSGLPRDPDAKQRVQERLRQEREARRVAAGDAMLPGFPPASTDSNLQAPVSSKPHLPAASSSGPASDQKPASDDVSQDLRRRGAQVNASPQARPVVAAGLAGAPQVRLSMVELRAAAASCTACALSAGRTHSVFSRGTGTSGICFVGEGPGAEEDLRGEPFVGAAGQLLDKMIQAMGLGRDDVYVCNIVKCRPQDNRKPLPDEVAACSGYLKRQLELVNPEVIVALGGTAVSGLLGINEGITRLRGTFRLYNGAIPVMPTFHPAYLLRTPAAKREVWADLLKVLAHVGRTPPARS